MKAEFRDPGVVQHEVALVQRLKERDNAAFEEFYRIFAPQLMHLATRFVPDEDAEEVVDDVLVEAVADISRFDHQRSSLTTWLLVRCRSRAIDRVRRLRAQGRPGPPESAQFLTGLAGPDDPSRIVEWKIALQAFWAVLSRQERQVVSLHHIYGLSYDEVAERMGIKQTTVKEYADRAREKARALR